MDKQCFVDWLHHEDKQNPWDNIKICNWLHHSDNVSYLMHGWVAGLIIARTVASNVISLLLFLAIW